MKDVFVVSALRTPTGKLLGQLASFSAPELCTDLFRKLVENSGITSSQIDEVIIGNVISAGIGQNPARQAAMFAGLSSNTPAVTINKVCGSGMKAIALGAQAIRGGDAGVVLVGGMESMSSAPFLLNDFRRGKKLGDSKITDAMVNDGLWDIYNGRHMGDICEFTVNKYNISREEQDIFAAESHRRASKAATNKWFSAEMVSLKIDGKVIDSDEPVRGNTTREKLSALKPVFRKNGTITAGNSSSVSDGASGIVLMSENMAVKSGVFPLARITGCSEAHLDPKWYPVAPVKAVKKLMKKTGRRIGNFALFEFNEAFAAQTIAVTNELEVDPSRVNIQGGAIALGHPVGSSGARIVVTLIHALKRKKRKNGIAALCLGGGGAMSLSLEVL